MELKFSEITVTGWILFAVLAIIGIVLLLVCRSKQKWTPKMLANGALCIALSFVLSCIRLFRMPQGGSITPASMLPLLAFAYFYGPIPGLLAGVAYGLLQMLQDAYIVGFAQAMLDYPLAYGCVALAGVISSMKKPAWNSLPSWILSCLLVGIGRLVCHTASGVVFFAEYASGSGMSPLLYSVTYNSYLFVDLALCLVILAIPQVRKAMGRMTSGKKLL